MSVVAHTAEQQAVPLRAEEVDGVHRA